MAHTHYSQIWDLGVLAFAFAFALSIAAGAEEADRAFDHLQGTETELAGWQAIEQMKWVRARELGTEALRQHGDSYAGHFILGVVMHYGEGDLARSAFHLHQAQTLYERRHGVVPRDGAPWSWHVATLRELASVYGEMDQPQAELEVFDEYDRAYQPKRLAQRVWPLMKLRRYDEARAVAKTAIATGRPPQRVLARSDLCAAECEAGNRELSYRACIDALTEYRDRELGGMVEYSNASEAALSMLKYDQSERLLGDSTQRVVTDSWGNPYQKLAALYLIEGRSSEAIEALKGGQELRLRRPAYLDQQGQALLDGTLAELLLVVGQTERAVQITQRAVDRPDRLGTSSGTERQASAASAIRSSVALRDQAQRELEAAVTATFWQGLKLRQEAAVHWIEAWRQRRRAAVLLVEPDFLVRSLRPYYVGGVDLMPWMSMELVDAVGSGVTLTALARARNEETLAGTGAFFDALEAEAEFQRDEWAATTRAVERALQGLPRAEALLRARISAIGGEALRRRGDSRGGAALFAHALAADPDVVRRLGLALPVVVESDGTELGREATKLVRRSPRFRAGEGFFITLRGGASPESCLLGPSRERIQCASVRLEAPASPQEGARRLVEELHQVAFALKADLTQSDLTTLDGSPTAQRADRQVKSLLELMGPGDKQ